MSTTLATILVGLGYDLSALEKGSPEAFRIVSNQSMGMSAEIKRASREGAESLRLIDEALGIHLSRPLTRILTQEFPGLAKGLQSILGAGVLGAVGVAGVEFFDKIAKSIEKAQKAQEELAKATEHVSAVFEQEMSAYEKKDKAITAAAAAVDKLSVAEQAQAKAAQEASGWFTKSLAAVGDWLHKASSFQSTLNLEDINGELAKFQQRYDTAALADSINKTKNATHLLASEFQMVLEAYDRMVADSEKNHPWWAPGSGTSKADISAVERLLVALEKLQDVQTATTTGVHNQEAAAAALKRQEEAARAVADLYRNIGESLKKLTPESDPLKKLADEIHLMRYKAEEDFSSLGKNSNDALQLRAAHAALASYESRLDQVLAKARADADVVKAQAGLPTKITSSATIPQLPGPGSAPILGAGGTAAAQFDTFMKDGTAQLKLAAEAYQDLLTPADLYSIKQRELNSLLKNGLIDQTAYTAAIQKAREEEAKASDQIDTLLRKGGASGGAKAFVMQWMGDTGKGSDGQFTFELLNKGLQGFEDETIKALTGAKASWKSYFDSLDQMALKFLLNKEFASLFKSFAGTSLGSSLGLQGLLGGANPSQIANTTALATNTAAVIANTAALSFSGASAAASGGGGMSTLFDLAIPAFANGTDSAPGGLAWVGEQGPELVNLPSGASVIPNAASRGNVHAPINIDARGAQMGVGEQIARALEHQAPILVTRAVVEAFETQRRTAGH